MRGQQDNCGREEGRHLTHIESVQFTMFHRSNKAVLIPYLIKAFLFAFNLEKKKTDFKYLSAA